MKKLLPVFIAMLFSVGHVGASFASDTADATDPHAATCKKHADEKKLTGDKAKKFIDECIKKAKKHTP